jgi:hypothetical protein
MVIVIVFSILNTFMNTTEPGSDFLPRGAFDD